MKNKIAEILEGSLDPWGEKNANYIVQEILDLLKEEGWLHKDDPVKGLMVERKYNQVNENAFEVGLEYERPLTVGEALERFIKVAEGFDKHDPYYMILCWLTTKDGGRIVREEE